MSGAASRREPSCSRGRSSSDCSLRPLGEIRGGKRLWGAAAFINFIGPSLASCSGGRNVPFGERMIDR